MKAFLIIQMASCCLALVSCSRTVDYATETERMLDELDHTLEKKAAYEEAKQQRIEEIRSGMAAAMPMHAEWSGHEEDFPDTSLYRIYDRLYNEYYQYNIDSAIFYGRKKLEIARRAGISSMKHDAALDLADRYVLSGMFMEARMIMDTIDVNSLDYVMHPRCYHIYNSLYNGMYLASDDPVLKEEYRKRRDGYRQMLYERLGQDDISRLYVESEMAIDNGRAEDILDDLALKYSSPDISTHEKAILSYIMGNAELQCGNREQAIRHYAESAINDLSTPVNEYKSLYELAALLYENGDIRRAYRYITRSVDDAMTANARINIQSINSLLPIISTSYNIMMKQNQIQLRQLLTGISVLSVLLIIAVAVTVRVMRKVSVAEKHTREKNDELQKVNATLQDYIRMLQEANRIKESYLARYLDMCSGYIEGLERYRSRLRRAAKNGGFAEIMENLRSADFIEKELQEFYEQFDATFLDLFPDFISSLNNLLQPDKRIEDTSRESILSTELRVLALIRLGVGDSVKIAHFLRRSVSTIYNYRVKFRNASISGREDFERRLMHIGSIGRH